MSIAVWAANLLGWPILQIAIARFTLYIPLEKFALDCPLYAIRSWERGGLTYKRLFAIKRWKATLPDAGPWFGGFSKRKMAGRDQDYLEMFILETRRAEFAHWCMLCCFPVFFIWNPVWACLVMVAYALVANLPCIIAQRYNRIILTRIREGIRAREHSSAPS